MREPATLNDLDARSDLEEWVFTISTSTGEIAKIEKIERVSGRRHELSTEEYDAIARMMSPSAASYAAYGYDPAQYGPQEASSRPEVPSEAESLGADGPRHANRDPGHP